MHLPPLAYFLAWRCHGTWLHGDERGAVDKLHNVVDTPLLAPDERRKTLMEKKLANNPVNLAQTARDVVEQTIRSHCEFRHWILRAINVRTNHVHLVVTCPESVSPEDAMSQFKAWSTRRLREAGLIPADSRVWAEHGSTRWLNNTMGYKEAIEYVIHGQ